MMKVNRKVLVVGLDGASFDLIGPWINSGMLPNLAKLIKSGVSGELKSIIPSVTCPAWNCFMTGKNPGKLGIYDFLVREKDSYSLKEVNPELLKRESIWDILSSHERTVGVINVPGTFPPNEVNGFMISGMLTPSEKVNFTYPKKLQYELNNIANGYELDLNHWDFSNEEKFIERLGEIEEKRRKATEFLMDTYDCQFFMVVFCGSDRIQHFMWKHMDPEHPLHEERSKNYKDAIKNYWVRLDQIIGELIKKVDNETTIIILSDHGFGTQDRTFYVNDWLQKKGYLTLKKGKIGFINKYRTYATFKKILDFFGLYKMVRKYVVKSRRLYGNVDWSHTKAYSLPHTSMFEQIYINVEGRDPEGCVPKGKEYERIRTEIIEQLKDLRDPITNKKLNVEVFKPEKIYSGAYVNQAPDIIYSINNLRCLSDATLGHDSIFAYTSFNEKQNATHRMNGILIVNGPDVQKGKVINTAELIDLAPTILHLMDVPIPKDVDGKVLKEIFRRNSMVYKKKVKYQEPREIVKPQYVWSKQDQEHIRERLKALGYID